jgi:hypothetical protein
MIVLAMDRPEGAWGPPNGREEAASRARERRCVSPERGGENHTRETGESHGPQRIGAPTSSAAADDADPAAKQAAARIAMVTAIFTRRGRSIVNTRIHEQSPLRLIFNAIHPLCNIRLTQKNDP